MNVNFKIRGVKEFNDFLKTIPHGGLRIALRAFTEYVIGNESHGLKHPDPYKYASRAKAYGSTGARFANGNPVPDGYFSAKQFRYVAAKTHGFTDRGSKRAGVSEDAWQYVEVSDWNYKIVNPEPGAYWTRDDYGQARQPALVGWRKVTKTIMDNFAGGVRSANAALSAWLKR